MARSCTPAVAQELVAQALVAQELAAQEPARPRVVVVTVEAATQAVEWAVVVAQAVAAVHSWGVAQVDTICCRTPPTTQGPEIHRSRLSTSALGPLVPMAAECRRTGAKAPRKERPLSPVITRRGPPNAPTTISTRATAKPNVPAEHPFVKDSRRVNIKSQDLQVAELPGAQRGRKWWKSHGCDCPVRIQPAGKRLSSAGRVGHVGHRGRRAAAARDDRCRPLMTLFGARRRVPPTCARTVRR